MYFFDTYALFEIIASSPAYADFTKYPLITGSLNIGELHYGLLKNFSEKDARAVIKELRSDLMNVVAQDVVMEAMEFRHQHKRKKFSTVDCIGYILAKRRGLVFLTGDKEFEGLPHVEFVK